MRGIPKSIDKITHLSFPSFSPIRKTTDVLRLMFFFPSGWSVERQVRQGSLSDGAVKQSMLGTLLEVPVPRNMSSIDFLERRKGSIQAERRLCK